jgi:signal transduction histidine kinase
MKLLQTTIRRYALVSFLILLMAIPLFYILLRVVVKMEVDEELLVNKQEVLAGLQRYHPDSVVNSMPFLDRGFSVVKGNGRRVYDSLYTVVVYDTLFKEKVPHRILLSHVVVNNQPYVIRIDASMIDYHNLVTIVVFVVVCLLVLLFAGLQLVNRHLSNRIWQPFYNTLQQLNHYRVEQHHRIELPASDINEFNDLNKAIGQLTERNYQAYISQKEFAENASHEMQTPLAVFQSKLELLMQIDPLTREQAGLISDMADASQRMNHLNRTLVLLTKIDNQQFAGKETVHLADVVATVTRQYEDVMAQKDIALTTQILVPVQVKANKALWEILVNNLLANAIRHNTVGGAIMVVVNNGQLIIQNTGKPEPLDEQRLFQRFRKDSNDSMSLGLGLAIAQKICELSSYQLQYGFTNGKHQFTVQFNTTS